MGFSKEDHGCGFAEANRKDCYFAFSGTRRGPVNLVESAFLQPGGHDRAVLGFVSVGLLDALPCSAGREEKFSAVSLRMLP
jgi:hypothetical protein